MAELDRFGRAALALANPAALANLTAQESRQQFQTEQADQEVLRSTAMQILQRAPAGSPARALAITTLRGTGLDDNGLFDAIQQVQPKPSAFTLGTGQVRFEQPGPGQPPVEVARGPEAQPRVPLVQQNFGEGFGAKNVVKGLGELFESGRRAAGLEANYRQLFDLMSSQDFQSGSVQPLLTNLQGVASSLGFEGTVEGIARGLGIPVGDLDKQESFHRVTRQLILESYSQVKGNLNRTENQVVADSIANLGTSPEGNIDAIAAGMAAAQLARQRGQLSIQATGEGEGRALLGRVLGDDPGELLQRKSEIAEDLRQRRSQSGQPTQSLQSAQQRLQPRPPGVPRDAQMVQQTQDGKQFWRTSDGKVLVWEP